LGDCFQDLGDDTDDLGERRVAFGDNFSSVAMFANQSNAFCLGGDGMDLYWFTGEGYVLFGVFG
jgi:hypothetical protein